jgi:hypothetical protein
MKIKIIRIILLIFLVNSCDKQSNPFIGQDAILYLENMYGESRDILILEDYTVDCLNLFEPNCIANSWCEWDGYCNSIEKDLLIVANQYQEGLLIYEIDDSNDLMLNEIYSSNDFEVIDNISIENDLELRKLIYSSDTQFLYMLDKFEYVYNAWLPGLIDENQCQTPGTLNPYQLIPYDGVSNYHTTQAIIDESDIDSIDEILLLFKYNVNNVSEQNLEGLASITTSSSKFGTSYLYETYVQDFGAYCDTELLPLSQSFEPYSSPIFDYNISDVYFKDDKIYIANPYNGFVIKDQNSNTLDISYFEDQSNNIVDGCELPNNSIHFTDSGDILYNINSEIGYFEFNFYGQDLMDLYECNPGPNNYFNKCLAGPIGLEGITVQVFNGDVNNQLMEIMVTGNKLIGNLLGNIIISDNNCGTLLGFPSISPGEIKLFIDEFHSFSVYDFIDNDIIDFNQDFKTNSKIKSIYEHNGYIVTGMVNDGCYITLLEQGSHNIDDMPIFGSSNFTINNIFYDTDKNKLLLSCGNNGVLVYDWDGQSKNVSFISHIVSSHAYSAKIFKDSYVIIATKYGVEIYNYETY